MITNSEREDYNNAILSRGLDPSDFELQDHEYPMQGVEVQPIKGYVNIKRISTGRQKSYKAGHGSCWPAEFEDDLNNGFFD